MEDAGGHAVKYQSLLSENFTGYHLSLVSNVHNPNL